MKLSQEQIETFRRDGYLKCPCLFSVEEIGHLQALLPELLLRRGPETHRDNDADEKAKLVFALEHTDEPYRRMVLHPRLLQPVETLLGSKVHVVQSRVNYKGGFSSTNWTWHQDFNKWSVVDKMKKPDAILVGVLLDEVTATNGPLMVIKGSHKFGHRPIPVQSVGLDNDLITEMAAAGEVEAWTGLPGSVVFIDALTVHGSALNMTPACRTIFYVAYNSVENTPIDTPREASRCGQDYTPLQMLADDCLSTLAPASTT